MALIPITTGNLIFGLSRKADRMSVRYIPTTSFKQSKCIIKMNRLEFIIDQLQKRKRVVEIVTSCLDWDLLRSCNRCPSRAQSAILWNHIFSTVFQNDRLLTAYQLHIKCLSALLFFHVTIFRYKFACVMGFCFKNDGIILLLLLMVV